LGILKPAFFNPFGIGEEEPEAPQEDWKDNAMRRQQEKLNARKKRLDTDYVETLEERRKRKQREYRWKAAQRQDESVAMIGEKIKIKVKVNPPFGMDIRGGDGGKVFIAGFTPGGNAQYQNIRKGDRIYSVEGIILDPDTIPEVQKMVLNPEGPLTFVFERLASDN